MAGRAVGLYTLQAGNFSLSTDEPTSLPSSFGIEEGNGSGSSLFRPPVEITSTATNMDSVCFVPPYLAFQSTDIAKWSSAFTKAWWDRGPELVLAAVGLCYGLVLALSQDRSFWLSSSIPRDFLPSLWFGIIVNTITGKVARRNKATPGRKHEDMVDRITVCLLVIIIALFNSAMMFIASRWA